MTDQFCGKGVTHILVDEDKQRIAGFVTLKATSLIMEYEEYQEGRSAIEITELAVDKDYERQNIGTDLVKLAVLTAYNLNKDHIGIEYVVLCADPEALDFYLHPKFDFKKLQDYSDIPREGWNRNCIPLLSRLPSYNE